MKIYVDEMPKDCLDCPCNSEYYYCNLLHETVDLDNVYSFLKNCPLRSLAEHDKQVRKQVVEEIRRQIISCGDIVYNDNGDIVGKCCGLSEETVMKLLDQIERSEKDETNS